MTGGNSPASCPARRHHVDRIEFASAEWLVRLLAPCLALLLNQKRTKYNVIWLAMKLSSKRRLTEDLSATSSIAGALMPTPIQTLGGFAASNAAASAPAGTFRPAAHSVPQPPPDGSVSPSRIEQESERLDVLHLGIYRSWDDVDAFAKLSLPLNSTVYSLACLLCDDIISRIRSDCEVYAHLWKLRIGHQIENGTRKWATRVFQSCDEDWKKAMRKSGSLDFVAENEECSTNLADLPINPATLFEFEYDFGSTVVLPIKVIGIGRPTPQTSQRPSQQQQQQERERIAIEKQSIEAIPAWSVPAHRRLDALFPSFSRVFMQPRNLCCTLGLSDSISGEDDVFFCTIEKASTFGVQGEDILGTMVAFSDMDEFFAVAEKAFLPAAPSSRSKTKRRTEADEGSDGSECESSSSSDSDVDSRVSESRDAEPVGGYLRLLFPCAMSQDSEERLKQRNRQAHSDWFEGPKICRFSPGELQGAKATLVSIDFSFASMFPLTHKNFTCGKFRWIVFKQGQLRVCRGRSAGKYGRECEDNQVIFTWSEKHTFRTLHHLMCAIEASWPPLSEDGNVVGHPEADADVGPKKPRPPRATTYASSARVFGNRILEPLVVGKVVSLPHVKASANSAVNCLAFGRKSSAGYRWLYSGHYDGTITKWDCESMAAVWTARAYGNDWNGQRTSFCGVTHIIVNSPGTQIFCFTNSHVVMSFSGELSV